MKKILYILFLAVSPLILCAQEKTTPGETGKEETRTQETNKKKEETESKPIFKDADGDGIDDNNQNAGKQHRKKKGKMDQFIDKDGDGINDSRTKGMGWSGKGKQKRFGRR